MSESDSAALAAARTEGALEALRDLIERLERENRKLERERDDLDSELDDARDEIRQLERGNEDSVIADPAQRDALAHARSFLEFANRTANPDAYTRIMNERAIEALSDLLGDR